MPHAERDTLRAIVEDVHDEMMQALVDASAREATPPGAELGRRLAAVGFGDAPATTETFWSICRRVLPFDSASHLAVDLVDACLQSPVPDASIRNLERFFERIGDPSVFLSTVVPARPILEMITTVFGGSQYMSDIIIRDPGAVYWLMEKSTWSNAVSFDDLVTTFSNESDAFTSVENKLNAVRRAHRYALLRIGIVDMVNKAPVEEVALQLSNIADAIATVVLDIIISDLGGESPPGHALSVIAMGKLGSRELNYSSDIDLIFVCEDCDDAVHAFYTQVARRFGEAVSELSPEGYLYRVDLRLRPDGKAGPLVNNLTGIRLYYEHRGRPWEFQAMLKARLIAGHKETAATVLSSISSLIFNPTLPYVPLDSIAAMREQIKENIPLRERDFNIKLMSGGIRDVEFIVQALQLMHGHDIPRLRVSGTLVALQEIATLQLLEHWKAENLAAAYRFFRLVEHRLQMMHQIKTHTVPSSEAEIGMLARRVSSGPLGAYTTTEFLDELSRHLSNVRAIADSLFSGEQVHPHSILLMLPEDDPRATAIIKQYGITNVGRAMSTLHTMAYGTFPRLFDRATRVSFEALLPLLLEEVADAGSPESTLVGVAQLATAGKNEAAYYRLLTDSAPARSLAVAIAGMSQHLTRRLCNQPDAFEWVLDSAQHDISDAVGPVADWQRFSTAVAERGGSALEERVTHQRAWLDRVELHNFARAHANAFGNLDEPPPGAVARAWAAQRQVALACDDILGDVDNVSLFVMGSYAVGEARMRSDLDVIVVSDGADIPDVTHRIQAINRWFTDNGLIKFDFRLRGEGASAPLVQDLSYYGEYFRNRMALWERIAFAKCRSWWGSSELSQSFLDELRAVLTKPYTRGEIAVLAELRRKLESLVRGTHDYETKRSPGARYDIEYIVAIGSAYGMTGDDDFFTRGTAQRLDQLAHAGILTREESDVFQNALFLFTLVDYLMELQSMTLPKTPTRVAETSRYLDRTFAWIGIQAPKGAAKLLANTRANVRLCFESVLSRFERN